MKDEKTETIKTKKGDTQEDVAKVIGVTRRGYQKMENEESQIKSDKAQKLAKYFGVSVGYLLGYEPEDMPKRSIYDEVYSALLRVKSENPNHDDRVAIREICMELIEATLEGY